MANDSNMFTKFGGILTKFPPLFAVIMPVISLILILVGFGGMETEKNVNNLWVPESTDYAKAQKYAAETVGPSTSSSAYAISTPRAGGNALTAERLLDLRDRFNATQRATVTVGNNTFAFDDVCYNPGQAYGLPCFRMHVLDCFHEGDYDFTPIHKMYWYGMAKGELIPGSIAATKAMGLDVAGDGKLVPYATVVQMNMPAGFKVSLGMMYSAIVEYALVSTAALGLPCKTHCANDGPAALLAGSMGVKAGTWETNTSCKTCLTTAVAATPKGTQDYIYVQGLAPQMAAVPGMIIQQPKVYDVSRAKKAYNVSKDKAAVDEFVKALAEQYVYKAVVQTAIVTSPSLDQCSAECPADGVAAVLAAFPGNSAGSWESNETCVECLKIEQPKLSSAVQDAIYVQGLAPELVKFGLATGSGPYDVSPAKAHYKASSDKDAVNFFLAQLMHGAVVETGIVSDAKMGLPCKSSCTYDGLAGLIAGATGQKAGTWEASSSCKSCLATAKAAINTSIQDVAYVQGVAPMMAVSFLAIGPNDYDVSKAKVAFNTSSDKAAVDGFVKGLAIDFMYTPVLQTAIVTATPSCNTSCKNDGIAAIVAGLTGQAVGSWETNATCQACLTKALNATPTATKDMMFVQGLAPMMAKIGLATGPTSSGYNLANARANYGVSTDKDAVASFLQGLMYAAVVDTGFVTSSALGLPCKAHCAQDGLASVVAAATGQKAGTWGTNASCVACLKVAVAATPSATKDYVYVQGVAELMAVSFLAVGPGVVDIAPAMAALSTKTPKDTIDEFMKQVPAIRSETQKGVEAQVDALIRTGVLAFLDVQTPYSFMTYGAGLGSPRPRLKDATTGKLMNESDVLATASGACYSWDGGLAIPANLNPILYGKPSPAEGEYNATNKLTAVLSFEHIYQFLVPAYIKMRVATRPAMFGGPLNITLTQAEEVLAAFKLEFEKTFSKGWDTTAGTFAHYAFSDDAGSGGSFRRTLTELTTDSLPLIVIYSIVTVVVAGLILASLNLVESKVMLGMVGALYAILGCFAGLGLAVICGQSLNVVHFWIMPFIIIGIGIDDMFMLACSDSTVEGGSDNIAENFPKAFANVAIPVTMTSLVNGSMFLILWVTSDIRAVYEAGVTGLLSTLILYVTMLLSFSQLVYLDNKRQSALRFDGLICMKASGPPAPGPEISMAVYNKAYKPLVTSLVGRIVLLVLGFILLGIGFGGMTQIKLGLDLQDFFPENTWEGKFATTRNEFFPVWPMTINWGQLEYHNPEVQLMMAKQWEDITATKNAAKASTTLVWTAAMATWGQTADAKNKTCGSIIKPNTMGLKLTKDGGFCTTTGCPVMEGMTEAKFAQCLLGFKASGGGLQYLAIGPLIFTNYIRCEEDCLRACNYRCHEECKTSCTKNTKDPDAISLPIKYSLASGLSLFGVGLTDTDNYVKLITDARAAITKNAGSICKKPEDCFMSGTPFTYWEQYLEIISVMYLLSGLAVLLSFIISFIFLFVELSMTGRGSVGGRVLSSALGALMISIISIFSLCTVVGICGLASVKMSGFSAMACLISTGLSVEYSVHVVHRFLEAPAQASGPERVHYAMEWLFKPTLMAVVTSALGVLMMAFSEFQFIRLYFFAPLAAAVLVSYFMGVFMLPALLGFMPQCMPQLKVVDSSAPEVQIK